ncbi:a14003f9-e6b6-41dc-af9e-575aa099f14d [Thermothielavioides terrestris]|uniref:A14003f9-e6b6-41dc-af9e-575aa099f14d n=1 Tax=Thermothielavioides terrestris TaxID=2587410 RepID=A0A3S4AW10_9PEZI|nr:a14003f9-e6b6-41dc-af9e-575aa099f14d [Thermothielavioides terrestris]
MLSFARRLLQPFRLKQEAASSAGQDFERPPTVAWLLAHRDECSGERARTKGATPTASLYRMYEYLVLGYITGLRTEIEYFFNQPSWAVSAIPDPEDPDPARYAILAVLPYYLVIAFNRLIERGLPRGSPAIIAGAAAEEELRAREVVLEQEPPWAAKVPPLPNALTIPDGSNREPEEETRSRRFLDMNIIVEEPHVLFV